jgi:hypothetical protein
LNKTQNATYHKKKLLFSAHKKVITIKAKTPTPSTKTKTQEKQPSKRGETIQAHIHRRIGPLLVCPGRKQRKHVPNQLKELEEVSENPWIYNDFPAIVHAMVARPCAHK